MSRNTETKTDEEVGLVCPECGMEQEEWGSPAGFVEGGQTYCCEGCPRGECTCE